MSLFDEQTKQELHGGEHSYVCVGVACSERRLMLLRTVGSWFGWYVGERVVLRSSHDYV